MFGSLYGETGPEITILTKNFPNPPLAARGVGILPPVSFTGRRVVEIGSLRRYYGLGGSFTAPPHPPARPES